MRGYIEDEFNRRQFYIMVDINTGERVDKIDYLMTLGEAGTNNYAYSMNGSGVKLILKSEA